MNSPTTPPKWTREPLSVGKTLLTSRTRRWSKEQWDQNEQREIRSVFGRRGLVAEFREPDDASRAVACWNALLPIESPEDFVREVREHCESVLKWWEKARFITTSDSEGEEYNLFDDEPKFVAEARRLLSLLNGERKDGQ